MSNPVRPPTLRIPLVALALCSLPAVAVTGRAGSDFAELTTRSPFGAASPLSAAANENPADSETFEYRGFYDEGDGRHYSIRHPASGAAAWLAAGEELNGLRVLAGDEVSNSVKVRINGHERLLHLPRSNTRALAPEEYGAPQIVSLLPGAPESAAVARIRHARAMSAPTAQPSLASAPSAPKTQAQNTSPEEEGGPDATKPDAGSTLKMGRGFNRVNSRIYASDHIAEHGAPPPAPAP